MSWEILDVKMKIILLPLLQAIAENFRDRIEFPLKVQKDARKTILLTGKDDILGCAISQVFPGVFGLPPCSGESEYLVFIHHHPWKKKVMMCIISHRLGCLQLEMKSLIEKESKPFGIEWDFFLGN